MITLFYLHGTLPISYRGATYNIPVTIYFDPPYPDSPPRCFVTPKGNMKLSETHQNLDGRSGMVYLPYLSQWTARSSSLPELITYMSSVFEASPPVYSTASTPQPQQAGGLVGAIGGVIGGFFDKPAPQPARPQGYGQYATPAQPVRPVQPTTPVVARPVSSQPSASTPSPVVAAHVTATPVGHSKHALTQQIEQALKDRWRFVIDPVVEDANRELERRRELRAQVKSVDELMESVKAEDAQCRKQVEELKRMQPGLQDFIKAHEGEEVSPEDLRDKLDAESRQVLDMTAEELALDEYLGALDELLASQKITIDDFMRETRQASRNRFMCQALRKKSESILQGQAVMPQPPAVAAVHAATGPVPTSYPAAGMPVARARVPA
eukprot:CAMPEP_0206434014 /NCGR_PEP_ID=MMETSP0324_2-20121206/8872_1 /ASSEMBLY_ACC=CAM_ASM_000836 /TAXON_ID=2866 /ORGANISM="Crypthecodinium cohnii, Strain Seligo" /LENGTH=380 /DNA_ID=CAMNT_0053900381 /DNA_START=356 /DNA_END=1498 /DNA_ORIENTATION=+